MKRRVNRVTNTGGQREEKVEGAEWVGRGTGDEVGMGAQREVI